MRSLSQHPSIRRIPRTGDLRADIENWFEVNRKPDLAAHSLAVAETSATLSARFGLDARLAQTAALVHDAAGVLPTDDMTAFALQSGWTIDPAEQQYPFLLHQRLSAVLAREAFGVQDPVVLSAVACHSTLRGCPSAYDMLLFLADKLSWDQAGDPPFRRTVSDALPSGLAAASLAYIRYVLDHGMLRSPHAWLLEAKHWLESSNG